MQAILSLWEAEESLQTILMGAFNMTRIGMKNYVPEYYDMEKQRILRRVNEISRNEFNVAPFEGALPGRSGVLLIGCVRILGGDGMAVGALVDVIEGFSFAWEVFGICAFVCEEAVQACTLGIASALNRGRWNLQTLGYGSWRRV